MINKIEFSAKNLTSNAGLFLLLEHANMIKMKHIKTMLCGNFIGIDKLERLKLLQTDPLINEFAFRSKSQKLYQDFWGTSVTKQPRC